MWYVSWDALINTSNQSLRWPPSAVLEISDIQFIPCGTIGMMSTRPSLSKVGHDKQMTFMDYIPLSELEQMNSKQSALKKCFNALAILKKGGRRVGGKKRQNNKSRYEHIRGSVAGVLSTIDTEKYFNDNYLTSSGSMNSKDIECQLWLRQKEAIALMYAHVQQHFFKSRTSKSQNESSHDGCQQRIIFSSLAVLKSSYTSLVFPWSFWETFTVGLMLPPIFLRSSPQLVNSPYI